MKELYLPTKDAIPYDFLERNVKAIEGGCWVWQAKISDKGYGLYQGKGAHRIVYQMYKGPLVQGLYIDHMCRNRACVNPSHLRQVTPAQNAMENSSSPHALNAKKTHCKQGHEFTPENTCWQKQAKSKRRVCRACTKKRKARYYKLVGKPRRQRQRQERSIV